MIFEISEIELDELMREKFGGNVKFEEGKITFIAAMGTVKFTLQAPKTPLELSKKFEIHVSMSLAVRMFLGKIKSELKKHGLHEAVKVSLDKIEVDLTKIEGNGLIEWLKGKVVKRFEITGEKLRVEI